MGAIPSKDKMPSAKFKYPTNGANTIIEKENFTIEMNVANFKTGDFVNADESYFAAPQQLDNQGQIIGHSHVVVEALSSPGQTTPTDPRKFAFFKGLNEAAEGGVLSTVVDGGLPAGSYKLSSINTAANHQPLLVPIAQHGSLDDAVYVSIIISIPLSESLYQLTQFLHWQFTVVKAKGGAAANSGATASGAAAANGGAAASGGAASAASGGSSTSTASAPATSKSGKSVR
jgi:hypothetical protein